MSVSEQGAGGAFIFPLKGAVVSPLMSEAEYKGALRQTNVCVRLIPNDKIIFLHGLPTMQNQSPEIIFTSHFQLIQDNLSSNELKDELIALRDLIFDDPNLGNINDYQPAIFPTNIATENGVKYLLRTFLVDMKSTPITYKTKDYINKIDDILKIITI